MEEILLIPPTKGGVINCNPPVSPVLVSANVIKFEAMKVGSDEAYPFWRMCFLQSAELGRQDDSFLARGSGYKKHCPDLCRCFR